MGTINNEIKAVIKDVIILSGVKLDILPLIDGWDVENPDPETLRLLKNYTVILIDEVKSKIVEHEKRLTLCT